MFKTFSNLLLGSLFLVSACKEESPAKTESNPHIVSKQDLKSDYLYQDELITEQQQTIAYKLAQCQDIKVAIDNATLNCDVDDPFTDECKASALNSKEKAIQARNCAYELEKLYEKLADIYEHVATIADK